MKNVLFVLFFVFSLNASAQTYIQGSNLIEVPVTTATAAGTTTLVATSKKNQQFTGASTQTVALPNATGLQVGRSFYISNRSTGTVTVNYNSGSLAKSLPGGSEAYFILENNGTSDGSWDISGGTVVLGVGTFDAQSPVSDGAVALSNFLYLQSATASYPGLVNNTTQTFSGNKTFTGNVAGANVFTGTYPLVPGNAGLVMTSNQELQVFAGGSTAYAYTFGPASGIQIKNTGTGGRLLTLADASTVLANGGTGVAYLTADATQLVTPGALTASNFSGSSSGANTGDVSLTAVGSSSNANGASLSGQVLTLQPANTSFPGVLLAADWNTFNSKQAAGNYITALTGDATASGPGSAALTLATVNSNVGSFGSSTSIPNFTVNAKGLLTAAGGNAVIAPAGTLTGTTLASNVVTSSLTSVGTISSGTWSGTTIALNKGGTGQTTKAAAFDALSPMTTVGDIIVGGASGTGSRLASGTTGQYLGGNTGAAPSYKSFTAPTFSSATISSHSGGFSANASGTYTPPAGVLYIRVVGIGGGGGGAASATVSVVATDGGDTTFNGGTYLKAGGGSHGVQSYTGGVGGSFVIGSGPLGFGNNGNGGDGTSTSNTYAFAPGGKGGAGPYGGGPNATAQANTASIGANSGSGGDGAGNDGASLILFGAGGGSGGMFDVLVPSPSAVSYVVGAGGAGGTSNAFAGGDGAGGAIYVWEYYQ